MGSRHPIRFGVFAESARTREQVVETARRAESAGYSTFLIRDHYIEAPFGHQLAPIATLATVAAVTTELRIGSLVFANDYRHPVMLAKEAATLDLLSGGRFELGLGAGFSRAEYEQAGLPFDVPGTRVDRLAESLRVLKGLFADTPCTFAGRHYTVAGLDSYPKPVQQPHPPIHVGGAGQRMLKLAAREADIVAIQSVSTTGGALSYDPSERLADAYARKIGWVREAAGDRFDALELSTTVSIVIDADREGAARRLAARRGWHALTPEQVLEIPTVWIGSVEQIVEEVLARREQYGLSYFVVDDADLDTAAPIVARLAGRCAVRQ